MSMNHPPASPPGDERATPAPSLARRYAPARDVPLAGYATLIGIFGVGLAGLTLASRRRPTADSLEGLDLLLLGLATHRLSRALTRDWVTAPLRAPFTEYQESSDIGGEVVETARGAGLRKAVGQLLTCRFCIGPWAALGLLGGYFANHRFGRVVATVFSAAALSDFLHVGYERAHAED
jgi:hypothetical protein